MFMALLLGSNEAKVINTKPYITIIKKAIAVVKKGMNFGFPIQNIFSLFSITCSNCCGNSVCFLFILSLYIACC